MNTNRNLLFKCIIIVLLAMGFLFASCPVPDTDTEGKNPGSGSNTGTDPSNNNPGQVKGLSYSHKSGHYSGQFDLTLTAGTGAAIYYSIDGSIPDPNKLVAGRTFKYSAPIEVKDRSEQANFLATAENMKNFYGDPNDSRGNMPKPPGSYIVPKVTVIRAISVSSSGATSDVATLTYFIGAIPADHGNHRILSIVTEPYNLLDVNEGMYVRGASGNRWNGDGSTGKTYNFRQNWRKPASFELFDSSRNVSISTNLEIRIRGGWSRAQGQKSMNIYFTNANGGINNLTNFQLIPGAIKADGTPLTSTKSFMIRNGGNDAEYTKFYDVFAQRLLKDRAFTTQSAVPCIVYLNGEYWGPYNLQERYSDNHTEFVFGIDRNNVVSIESGSIDDGTPADESDYNNMMNRLISHNMSNSDNYDDFLNCFDVQSFIDYWAAEIYLYNEDWPHNNFRLWRARNKVPNNPYGDGRWRYQMLDMDFIMGIYNSGNLTGQSGLNAFDEILSGGDSGHTNNRLFANLLNNDDFRRQFTNTMMDLYNVHFHPSTYEPMLNEIINIYRPLMGDTSSGYFSRWGRPWDTAFDNKVNEAYAYLRDIRPVMVNNYLPHYLGVNGLSDVTIVAKDRGMIMNNLSVTVNTVTPKPGSGIWAGQYYESYPITVTVNDISGYTFENWTVTGGTYSTSSNGRTITVTLSSSNAEIAANYSSSAPITNVASISLNKSTMNLTTGNSEKLTANVLPANATYKTVTWISSNPQAVTVDQNGNVTAIAAVSGGDGATKVTITAKTTDGDKIAACTVTVNPVLQEDWWGLMRGYLDLLNGDSYKVNIWMNNNPPNRAVKWASNDPSIASVENGLITAHSLGYTTITCTSIDGAFVKECNVNVRNGNKLLDLASALESASPGSVTNFSTTFPGLSIGPGGELGTHVNFEIIYDDGVKKLKIDALASWGAGLDINNAGIEFEVGDIIDIKGKYRSDTPNRIFLNIDHMKNHPLNRDSWGDGYTYVENYWDFERAFTLTQDEIDTIMANSNYDPAQPQAIRVRAADEPRNVIFYIEKLTIYRFTD